jgi:tetratricopeptide (TPR) repeat protein
MKIPFQTSARKWMVVAAALAFGALYFALIAREFLASWIGTRPELKSLERAAWLDPGDADYRNHLGRYYVLVARDPASAIGYFKNAVQLNPHSARYWFDLAGAYQVMGDTSHQTAALEQAIHADAMTPDVAWEAANLYLVQGENEKALREFGVVMASDPSLAGSAMQYCWRIDPDVDSLLRDVVPHTAEAYLAFLTLLEVKQETNGTFKVWDALMQTHQPFDLQSATDYIQFLLRHQEVDESVAVWRQAADRFHLGAYLPSPSNLMVNGNFSLDVLNGGFDWQYQKQPGVILTYDPGEFHSGRRSMLIAFDGPGINDAGIFQLVALQPNTTYDFSAFYKSGELEGAGGPHLTVQDRFSQAIYYDSGEMKEPGFWKSVDGEFTTGPECKLVIVYVRRLPEGSPIRGKLWIDDFHLVRKPS